MELLIIFGVMALFMIFMTRGAKKAQQAQIDKRNEAIVIGNNVVTTAGFFGRIVDIDGDAITLESPSGDETVWLRTSIMAQMDVPLAEDSAVDGELEQDPYAVDGQDVASVDQASVDGSAENDLSTPNPFDDDNNKGSAWK